MKVSVIMSAYNAQKTINKAIDSVLAQTYKDLELIIVNDSSTDDTDKLISQYTDERIKYIKYDINKGCGLARRSGIHAATGEYIAFLDSDDYYAKDYIETLINATNNGKIDMVSSGYIAVKGGKEIRKAPNPREATSDTSSLYFYDESNTLHFLNVQLLKKALFDHVEYSDRRFIEDSSTFVKLIYYAKSRKAIDYAGYYYVQNDDSLIHTCSKYKNLLYQMLCSKDTCEFYEQIGHSERYGFDRFLLKYINLQNLSEEDKRDADKYTAEKKELMEYITDQFNKRL